MRTQPQELDSRRSVAGAVQGDGTSGSSEFRSTRNAVGDYTIRFLRPFRATPAPVATPAVGGICRIDQAGPDYFHVFTYTTGPLTSADMAFQFIVRGLA